MKFYQIISILSGQLPVSYEASSLTRCVVALAQLLETSKLPSDLVLDVHRTIVSGHPWMKSFGQDIIIIREA